MPARLLDGTRSPTRSARSCARVSRHSPRAPAARRAWASCSRATIPASEIYVAHQAEVRRGRRLPHRPDSRCPRPRRWTRRSRPFGGSTTTTLRRHPRAVAAAGGHGAAARSRSSSTPSIQPRTWTASRRSTSACSCRTARISSPCTPRASSSCCAARGIELKGAHAVVHRPQRHRREADGDAAAARARHRDDLPLADAGPAVGRARRPTSSWRPIGRTAFVQPELRQAGRHGHRRRDQPGDRRRGGGALFPPESPRRAAFARRGALVVGDVHPGVVGGGRCAHAGARRGRSAHHRAAAQQHAGGGRGAARPTARACPGPDVGRMRRVALTGGIATGKSWVRRRFAHHGVPTIDADVLAHAAVAPGTPGAARILERFGTAVRSTDGGIDRKALGSIVFGDEQARRDLEAIVHPAVYQAIEAWFAALPPVPCAVADIPLLYETGREADFDTVVVTACAPDEQVAAGDCARRPLCRGSAAADRGAACRWRRKRGEPITSFAPTGAMRKRTHRWMRSWRRCQSDASSSLCRGNPLLDERVPLVAVGALPQELRAPVAAPRADVRIEIEDDVAGQRQIAVDQLARAAKARQGRATPPRGSAARAGCVTSACSSSSNASASRPRAATCRASASRARQSCGEAAMRPPAQPGEALRRLHARVGGLQAIEGEVRAAGRDLDGALPRGDCLGRVALRRAAGRRDSGMPAPRAGRARWRPGSGERPR